MRTIEESIASRDMIAARAAVEARLDHFRPLIPEHGRVDLESDDIPKLPGFEDGVIPEVDAGAFSVDALRSAMKYSGSLIVRGLLDNPACSAYRGVIDSVIDEASVANRNLKSGKPITCTPFYNPPANFEACSTSREYLLAARGFHAGTGSAMCIESPSTAEELLGLYERLGLKEIIAGYLGERPCLTAQKWVLRRTKLEIKEQGWHQDGAFMGQNIKSLNMWISLSHCGGRTGAPGMDILPRKLDTLVNSDGAAFDWAANPDFQSMTGAGISTESPIFEEGDAIFFDHMNLHRTQFLPSFERRRYAIETWFFGERCFPKEQIPMAW